MRRGALIGALLLLLGSLHVLALGRAGSERALLPRGDGMSVVLPSPLLKITALEFDSVLADYLFLETMAFYGGTQARTDRPRVKEWEWQWLAQTTAAVTDLDPYFLDPYLFENATFTWEAGRVREANAILEKGSGYRTWDWMLPFFAGFNHFFFLQENERAAELLMEASRRPKADPILASIASKLAYKARRTETAIHFLEEILKRTEDFGTKQRFERRLEAFHNILALEKAVERYTERFRRSPKNINALIASGIVQELPSDPYGGRYYLDPSGNVRSTTESELVPHRKERH